MREHVRSLGHDPFTGVTTEMHFSADGETYHIVESSDVEAAIEFNKSQFNQTDERARWNGAGAGNHVARIPPMVYYGQGLDKMDEKDLLRWIDDRDNSVFKLRPGRLV